MLSALILAALVKLNLEIQKPLVPAGIFAGFGFFVSLISGYPLLAIILGPAINLGFGFLYFWLLKRTEGEGSWWAVLILGIVAYMGLTIALS